MNTQARFIAFNPFECSSFDTVRSCPMCRGRKPPWRTGPNGQMLCNSCGLQFQRKKKKKKKKSRPGLSRYEPEDTDVVQPNDTMSVTTNPISSVDHGNSACAVESLPRSTQSQVQDTDYRGQPDLVVEPRIQDPQMFFEDNQTLLSYNPTTTTTIPARTSSALIQVNPHIGYVSSLSQQNQSLQYGTIYPTVICPTTEGQPARSELADLVFAQTAPDSHRFSAFQSSFPLCAEPERSSNSERFFYRFRSYSEALHAEALRRDSSMYAAIERFHLEIAGETIEFTTYAVLREEYYRQRSPAAQGMITSGPAMDDLEFSFVFGDRVTEVVPLDNSLHYQRLVDRIGSERTKRAIWDLSRLPKGSHLEDSQTYVWLQRTLFSMNTSSGHRVAMDVRSGCEKHQFRKLHRVLSLPGSNAEVYTMELYGAYYPKIREACIESCQSWFVAVLDEAGRLQDTDQQFAVVNVNKKYMFECTKAYADSLIRIGIEKPLHICSGDCVSHFQPYFHTIVDDTERALQELFSTPEDIQNYIRGQLKYPTQQHLHLCRILGQAQSLLHFSDMILPDGERQKHLEWYRPVLREARMKLEAACVSPLKWNYLPPEIENRASIKVELAKEANRASGITFIF